MQTAVIQTEMGDKYVAANGKASVYKPRVFGNQWSVSRIRLMSGSDSIEAGWMVSIYSSKFLIYISS